MDSNERPFAFVNNLELSEPREIPLPFNMSEWLGSSEILI